MATPSLLTICVMAFCAVFVLLAGLAAAMRVLTMVFPERRSVADPAVVAAISTAVASVLPGARVSRIEEVR